MKALITTAKSVLSACLFLSLSLFWSSPMSAQTASTSDQIPEDTDFIVLGMGCFWGAEKRMAAQPGVLDVMSGYAGGSFTNPSYQQILNQEGRPGVRNHAEVVRVVFDPRQTTLEQVLAAFWENHDPTQGDRQGNDRGSNYRSAIYFNSPQQGQLAQQTRDRYQQALTQAGKGTITTEIAALELFWPAEDYHQDYLVKNPKGYCGLGGTGVKFPGLDTSAVVQRAQPLDAGALSLERQLIVFEAEGCSACARFKQDILASWQAAVPVAKTLATEPPKGWTLDKPLWATPTVVLFEQGTEQSRYTGFSGETAAFWTWLGQAILDPETRRIAFENGTERPFTGSLLDNKASGYYVDPVSGVRLFRSDAKFESGSGWPSFFQPLEGAVSLHEDRSQGMHRVEVRSASSGIHLGHVFDDGPPPTGKRYCINSKALRFVPD